MNSSDIIIFSLLAVGLYLICTINNDNCTVKNSGTLNNLDNNIPNNNNNNNNYNNIIANNIAMNDNLVKPIEDDNNFNSKFDNNYSLGVDINDPSNLKYKLQAPNYNNNKLNPNDLLPSSDMQNNDWDFGVPTQKISLNDANLLGSATNKIGFNTQGNTLKNASTDLRGNIPNPKIQVGPFNNSSYDPDNNIKAWCN